MRVAEIASATAPFRYSGLVWALIVGLAGVRRLAELR